MRTLDRYLLKEVTMMLVATVVVLLLIILSHRLAQYLGQAATGRLAQGSILLLLGLQGVRFLVELIPAATLLAIMLALGRLYRDSEMVALNACGLGPAAVYRALFILALPLALVMMELSLSLVPKALRLQYEIRDRARQEAELWMFRPGAFREISAGRHVIYVGGLSEDQRQLQDVFVYSKEADSVVTTATTGEQRIDRESGARYLLLSAGQRIQGNAGESDFQLADFQQLKVRVDAAPPDPQRIKRKALPTSVLLGSEDLKLRAELQRRLSAPLTLLLLTLLAPLLARARPREGRYGRIVIAILAYAVYANFLSVGQTWIERGVIPANIGLWWVHGLMLAFIAVLWLLNYGLYPLRRASTSTN